jgi:hypothetical protein
MQLQAIVTPSALFLSGQSGTEVRHSFSLLRCPLINTTGHIAWISETLGAATKLAPAGLDVSVRIFITGEDVPQQSDDASVKSGKETYGTEGKSPPPSLFEDPAVQITSGSRANLKYILQKEADLTCGRMGVTGLYCQLSAKPFPPLITRLTRSMRFSIHHRHGKRCPRFLNCRTFHHHEGRSQHHATY